LHLSAGEHETTITAFGKQIPETAWTLAFVEAHRAGGWLPLHAAVLIRENRAVALTGVSGAGKSTAALRLAGAKFQVLAEDQAWLHPVDGRIVGLDTHLRAFEDSVRRFAPHLLEQAEGYDAHGKLLIPIIRWGEQGILQTLLVFGLSELLTSGERVRALWEATGVPLTGTGKRVVAAGVTALLPRLRMQGMTRENVLELAQTYLSSTG